MFAASKKGGNLNSLSQHTYWPQSFLKGRNTQWTLFTSNPAGKQSPPIFILRNKSQHFLTFDSLSCQCQCCPGGLGAPFYSRQIPSLLLSIVPFGKEPPSLWLLLAALYGRDLFTFAVYWYSHKIISPSPLRLKWLPTSSLSTVASWARCQMQLTVKVLFLFLHGLCMQLEKKRESSNYVAMTTILNFLTLPPTFLADTLLT